MAQPKKMRNEETPIVKRAAIATLLLLAGHAGAEPTIYTDEAAFLADLAALAGSTVHESFEDDGVWADSRNSIVGPGSAPSVASQGLVWTSNHAANDVATGTVGGGAPDGAYAIYSLPHGLTTDSGLYCDSAEDPDIPIECFQDDGLTVASESGGALYAFGGRIDTANAGKVTFLLDGVDVNGNDTDNVDNWQREGDLADGWAFVGVIDPDGFATVELRELRGKDHQQVLLFADDFTIRRASPACSNGVDDDGDGRVDFDGGQSVWGACTGVPGGCPAGVSDYDGDGVADPDLQCGVPWQDVEGRRACGLGAGLAFLLPPLLRLRRRRAR
jgi:hypothetical protein